MKIYMIGNKEEENCYQNFKRYEDDLTAKGHIVINPLKIINALPIGVNNSDYVVISTSLIRISDAVFYIPGYEKSLIASLEKGNAIRQDKKVFE